MENGNQAAESNADHCRQQGGKEGIPREAPAAEEGCSVEEQEHFAPVAKYLASKQLLQIVMTFFVPGPNESRQRSISNSTTERSSDFVSWQTSNLMIALSWSMANGSHTSVPRSRIWARAMH